MEGKRPGRPLAPLDPGSSKAAQLGAELRARRQAQGLTLKALGELAGYSIQHISEVERAKTSVSRHFVAACDRALGAEGALLALLPAVVYERAMLLHDRAAARRLAADEGRYDEDVGPTNRRGLLGAGAATALGGLGAAAAPAAARLIDPELPAHWTDLLALLDRHDSMFGAHAVLGTVLRELHVIAEHREVARGDLRTELLRVEARWTEFAAFLSNDAGQRQGRTAYTDRALRLAQAAGDPDTAALARMRRAQWAVEERDGRRAVAFAEAALRGPGVSEATRARCALRAALGHALTGDAVTCQRHLDAARPLAECGHSPGAATSYNVRAYEARCWLWMQPSKAIPLYESALREWPRDQMRCRGAHQTRLALACAATGERDRAEAEGRKALAIARSTRSSAIHADLKRLGVALRAN